MRTALRNWSSFAQVWCGSAATPLPAMGSLEQSASLPLWWARNLSSASRRSSSATSSSSSSVSAGGASRSSAAAPLLFTPGPLTTSDSVRAAMKRDLGSRDTAFVQAIADVRNGLLHVAGVSKDNFECVIVQGSGTFGVESVIGSCVPRQNGKLLVIENGAYGQRITKMAHYLSIPTCRLSCSEDAVPQPADVDRALQENPDVTHVVIIHHETTSGVLNPVEEVGQIVRRHNKTFIVDAMSSFGATPLDLTNGAVDFLISSSNKCIEGVPGFSFCIARKSALQQCQGNARSLSLDLYEQWKGLETNGQFRFTPPTHAILAFQQALKELRDEGGVAARAARYQRNKQVLVAGMKELGFRLYVSDQVPQGSIITSFLYPEHANWDFKRFYDELNGRGFVIYPGKVTNADCFRIGHIGHLFENDMHNLLRAITDTLDSMQIKLR